MSLFDAVRSATEFASARRQTDEATNDVVRQTEIADPVEVKTTSTLIFRVLDECDGLTIKPVIDGLI